MKKNTTSIPPELPAGVSLTTGEAASLRAFVEFVRSRFACAWFGVIPPNGRAELLAALYQCSTDPTLYHAAYLGLKAGHWCAGLPLEDDYRAQFAAAWTLLSAISTREAAK